MKTMFFEERVSLFCFCMMWLVSTYPRIKLTERNVNTKSEDISLGGVHVLDDTKAGYWTHPPSPKHFGE